MIKTVLIFIYIAVSATIMLPIGLIAIILYFIGFRKSMVLLIYWVVKYWASVVIKLIGCNVAITGRENIPENGGVCFVSNHCGYFDIILLLAHSRRPIGFIAKKELLFLPVINIWIFLIGGLFIDRSSVKKAMRTINKGVERIKNGRCIIIFPEGHRSKGQGLLPFHPGSLRLATMAQSPIVPVAISGSYDVFEKTGRVIKSDVKVAFCKPIETAGLPAEDRKIVLCDRIYSVIKEKLAEINKI